MKKSELKTISPFEKELYEILKKQNLFPKISKNEKELLRAIALHKYLLKKELETATKRFQSIIKSFYGIR